MNPALTAHRRSLAEHIRDVLADKIMLADELAALRVAFAPLAGLGDVVAGTLADLRDAVGGESAALSPAAWGTMAETLILLRSIVSPEKTRAAQSIVSSIGLPIWNGKTFRDD